jgi:hypothetical protein
LERETGRNLERLWPTDRVTPDFKTIADFHKDNNRAIRAACGQFVALCPESLSCFPLRLLRSIAFRCEPLRH